MKIFQKILNYFDWLITVLAILSGAIIIFTMCSITLDVLMRQFFNRPIQWAIELSEIGLVATVFLGAAWLLRKEGHVNIDIVLMKIRPKYQAMLNTITSIFGMMICLVITYFATKVAIDHFQRGLFSQSITEFPTFPRYTIIALGTLMLTIQYCRRSLKYFHEWKNMQ